MIHVSRLNQNKIETNGTLNETQFHYLDKLDYIFSSLFVQTKENAWIEMISLGFTSKFCP